MVSQKIRIVEASVVSPPISVRNTAALRWGPDRSAIPFAFQSGFRRDYSLLPLCSAGSGAILPNSPSFSSFGPAVK